MKNTNVFKSAGVSILLTSVITFSSAMSFAGGGGTGGGHPLEAAFKTAAIKLGKELTLVPQSISKYLKFDAHDLIAGAFSANVKCATGGDLVYLKQQEKLAYVREAGTILLNCYKDSASELILKEDWEKLLNSLIKSTPLAVNSKVLLAHEVLRSLNAEGENQYLNSASIASVDFENRRRISEIIRKSLVYGSKQCSLAITTSSTCGDSMTGYKPGSFINVEIASRYVSADSAVDMSYCIPGYANTVDGFKNLIVDPASDAVNVINLINYMEKAGCLRE